MTNEFYWHKINDGLYEKKKRKKRKPKKKRKLPDSNPIFKGLGGSNRTNRGPWK